MSLLNAIGEVLFAKNCEQGSRNLIWAAIGVPSTPRGKEDNEGVNLLRGAYIVHAQVKECSDYALSEEGRAVCERFWVGAVFVHSFLRSDLALLSLG